MSDRKTIDELSGVDLDRAVATALGWVQDGPGDWWHDKDGTPWWLTIDDRERFYIGQRLATFSPHDNIGQAFNIGQEYYWDFQECIRSDGKMYILAECCTADLRGWDSSVYFYDDSEKKSAYATARCRAWLKAMGYHVE